MSESSNDIQLGKISAIAESAYIFAFPILENYKTMDRIAGANSPGKSKKKFNTLLNNSRLLGPEFKKIVAPNNDTVYSSTWLDLSHEPLVLSVPDIPDKRYYVFQMVSMYNYNFGYVGSRSTGYSAGSYLIAGHDWIGETPAGIHKVFRSETRFVFLFGRTLIDGPEDVENVKAIQKGYVLQPLSGFLGKSTVKEQSDPEFPPYDAAKAASAEFISYFNFILGNAAIHPDDKAKVESFAEIGVGPGKPFSVDDFSKEIVDAINQGIASAREKIRTTAQAIGIKKNGWNTLADSHGPREIMAKRPLVNCAGAAMALYGNDKEEANNYSCSEDSHGNSVDGAKTAYMLRFDKDNLPPVKAFWSITLYEPPMMSMVENPIKRYSIGDRTRGLKYDRDGSLTIYIQHETPEADKRSNWLPCPAGPFVLALRNYWPDEKRFPSFTPPGLKRNDL